MKQGVSENITVNHSTLGRKQEVPENFSVSHSALGMKQKFSETFTVSHSPLGKKQGFSSVSSVSLITGELLSGDRTPLPPPRPKNLRMLPIRRFSLLGVSLSDLKETIEGISMSSSINNINYNNLITEI